MAGTDIKLMDTLKEKVAARIRDTFAELIPEEAFNTMVEIQINEFIKAEIPKIVSEELEKKFREQVNTMLGLPEFQFIWTGSDRRPGEALKEIIRELAPDLVAAAFGNVIAGVTEQVRQSLTRGY